MISETTSAPELIYYCEFNPKDWENRLEINFSGHCTVIPILSSIEKESFVIDLEIKSHSTCRAVPEGFFGEKILNITAIVGKNGVGKTTIFRNIYTCKPPRDGKSFFMVYKDTDDIFIEHVFQKNISFSSSFKKFLNEQKKARSGLCFIKLKVTESVDREKTRIVRDMESNSTGRSFGALYLLLRKSNDRIVELLESNFRGIVEKSISIRIKLPVFFDQANDLFEKIVKEKPDDYRLLFLICLINYIDNFASGVLDTPKENLKINVDSDSSGHREAISQILYEILESNLSFEEIGDKLEDYILRTEEFFYGANNALPAEYFDELISRYNKILKHEKISVITINNESFIEVCLIENYFNLDTYEFLNIIDKVYSVLDGFFIADFGGYSSGEKTILYNLSSLFNIYWNNKKNLIFFIDEYDRSLHPEWARKYLYFFVELLAELPNIFQIVLTTHSPYLISDLPKENIRLIYKKKDKDGNETCDRKVDTPVRSFASNYYDILSDSFFLEDTIGEFAKQKIQSWIKQLNDLESSSLNDHEKLVKVDEISELIKIVDDRFMQDKLLELVKDVRNNILKKADKALQASLIDDEIAKLEAMKKQLSQERSSE